MRTIQLPPLGPCILLQLHFMSVMYGSHPHPHIVPPLNLFPFFQLHFPQFHRSPQATIVREHGHSFIEFTPLSSLLVPCSEGGEKSHAVFCLIHLFARGLKGRGFNFVLKQEVLKELTYDCPLVCHPPCFPKSLDELVIPKAIRLLLILSHLNLTPRIILV